MRYIFLFLILILIANNISYAEATYISRPEWKHFCPDGWQDAEYREIKWYWPYSVKQTQEELNYWATKKSEFEEQIKNCDMLLDEFKPQCYWDVKTRFRTDFEDHKLEVETKKIFNKGIDDNIYRNPRPFMINIIPTK